MCKAAVRHTCTSKTIYIRVDMQNSPGCCNENQKADQVRRVYLFVLICRKLFHFLYELLEWNHITVLLVYTTYHLGLKI